MADLVREYRRAVSDPQIASLRATVKAQDERIAELEAALSKAIAYCDEALHPSFQYRDERGRLIAVLDGKQ